MVTATELNYKNFGKCVKLDNGMASIIVTVDVGPRIISYCLDGHENMLLEDVDREFKDDSLAAASTSLPRGFIPSIRIYASGSCSIFLSISRNAHSTARRIRANV